MITIVVSALVLNGVIMSLVNSMVLNEYNQGFSIAMNFARAQIEGILSRRSDFSNIVSIPSGTLTVTANGINGLYRVDVIDVIPNQLKDVKVAVCWKARGGRIIGDCTSDNSGTLKWKSPNPSSPCMLETAIAAR